MDEWIGVLQTDFSACRAFPVKSSDLAKLFFYYFYEYAAHTLAIPGKRDLEGHGRYLMLILLQNNFENSMI